VVPQVTSPQLKPTGVRATADRSRRCVGGPGQVAANQSVSSAESLNTLRHVEGVCIGRELTVEPYHFDHDGTAEVDNALACYKRSHTAIVGLATAAP
jgi:hypothetical protein